MDFEGNRVAPARSMGNSGSMRADDGEGLLAGYVTGPAAATEATATASQAVQLLCEPVRMISRR
jgi:hypothetical protein